MTRCCFLFLPIFLLFLLLAACNRQTPSSPAPSAPATPPPSSQGEEVSSAKSPAAPEDPSPATPSAAGSPDESKSSPPPNGKVQPSENVAPDGLPPAENEPQMTDPLVPEDGKSPAQRDAEDAFAAPEGTTRLLSDGNLWLDRSRNRLIVDGYVALDQGPLEMFACPVGTKEHEAVVAVLSTAKAIHAGLLALGAIQGTPVSFTPEYRPATGQRIAIWVMWKNKQGEVEKCPAQHWIQVTGTEKTLELDWVFAGSSFWKDPSTGQEYYQADSGDLVCVSNFSTATLDLPVESSGSDANLLYSAYAGRVPPRGTPVRLVLIPIPVPRDEPGDSNNSSENRAAVDGEPRLPPEDALLLRGVR